MSDIVLAARVSARVMPRHCSDSSPPDLIRWSMLRCSLRAPVQALRERDFCMDARVKPGHDGEGKERKKIRRRNADRRNGRSPCRTGTAAPPYGRRTSIGVPPRFLLRRPNATAQLQSALPGMGPVSGRYPQTGPSQYSEAPRRPVVLPVGRVPEAARERVASPPAGTALALAARNASRPRPNIGRDSELYVTEMGTNVNDAVT